MKQLFINASAERKAHNKRYEDDYLSRLNNEYSDYMLTGDLTRIQWGLPKIEKLMQCYKRSLMSKTEYNKRRLTIEKFIFNK